MNGPATRMRRLQSDLENAMKQLDDFREAVKEISDDPMVHSPSEPVLAVLAVVEQTRKLIGTALADLQHFAKPIIGETPTHKYVGLVVDESAGG